MFTPWETNHLKRTGSSLSSTLDDEKKHFIFQFNVPREGSSSSSKEPEIKKPKFAADVTSWLSNLDWFDWMKPYPEKDSNLLQKTANEIEMILKSKFGSTSAMSIGHLLVFLPSRLRTKLEIIFRMKEKVCVLKEFTSIPNREQYIQIFEEAKYELDLVSAVPSQGCCLFPQCSV